MLGVNYIIATGLAFLIAVTLNYLLSRKFVFNKTETLYLKGYIQFILVASIGVTLTIAGMYALVTLIGVYYLLARCLISSLVGIGNYLFNLYCNFKVVGEH
jgi:putative flippase GtrA